MREETPRPIMLYVEGGMFIGKEMVFCKDCKYWLHTFNGDVCARDEKADFNDCNPTMTADDFCSRGERKDG